MATKKLIQIHSLCMLTEPTYIGFIFSMLKCIFNMTNTTGKGPQCSKHRNSPKQKPAAVSGGWERIRGRLRKTMTGLKVAGNLS